MNFCEVYLEEGNYSKAISCLKHSFREDTDTIEELILIERNLKTLKRSERLMQLTKEQASVQANQIHLSLFRLCRKRPVKVKNELSGSKMNQKALVIGCQNYPGGWALRNPRNDAKGMERVLQNIGIDVKLVLDPNKNGLMNEVRQFVDAIQDGDTVMFYFSGHGCQIDDSNFLVPILDFDQLENLSKKDLLSAEEVLSLLASSSAGPKLLLLDACRNIARTRSLERDLSGTGLSIMGQVENTFIGFSAAPGKVASDGIGDNGLFTGRLLKHLPTPEKSITQIFQLVRDDVVRLSGGKQRPWSTSDLSPDFIFEDDVL